MDPPKIPSDRPSTWVLPAGGQWPHDAAETDFLVVNPRPVRCVITRILNDVHTVVYDGDVWPDAKGSLTLRFPYPANDLPGTRYSIECKTKPTS